MGLAPYMDHDNRPTTTTPAHHHTQHTTTTTPLPHLPTSQLRCIIISARFENGEAHTYEPLCGALAPSTPRTPGGSQIQAFMWGPGAQYAKDPWKFTSISFSVGPWCPVRQGPREVHNYKPLRGAPVPSTPRPREVHKHGLLRGAPVPSTARTRGGSQIQASMWGPGAQYAKDPGKFTNIGLYVGPGNRIHQGPREQI